MIGYTKETTDLVIPSVFQSTEAYDANGDGVEEPVGTWYKITKLDDGEEYTGVFDSETNLTSVIVPDTVTYLGAYSFYGCANVESISIPDSVTHIGRECKWSVVFCE